MPTKLTILACPLDASGHYNATIGICQQLLNRGHKVIFAVQDGWRNKLKDYGFEEEWYNPGNEANPVGAPKLDVWGEMVAEKEPVFLMTPEEQILAFMYPAMPESIKQAKDAAPALRRIIQKVKPDVILADMFHQQPAIMNSGIPWVLSLSASPLVISTENVPPAFTGYATTGEDRLELWANYRKKYKSVMNSHFEEFQQWVIENGGPSNLENTQYLLNHSPYANIYMYPEELDYTGFRPNPPNWHRFDAFVRTESKEAFEIPEKLKNGPGKLIYFSMGTIGCSLLNMMKRLIAILAKSPHRFIVSKGPLGDQFELADNMWGAVSVPQTKVLPLVDLVISHGGNNTVTESFYFGKPLIVLPLFADQLDNAQRLQETRLGIRLHSHKVTEQELLGAIEKIASDEELAEKLKIISKRIQGSNSPSRAAELVESVALNNKK